MQYSLAFTPLIVMYTVEILPYSLRAKGFNVFNFVISLALIFNQYVNPIALEHIGWKYYVRPFFSHNHLTFSRTDLHALTQIVYCCWIAFEFVFLYIFIVETKNLSLEETAALFDGDDVRNAISNVATEVRHDDLTDEKGSGSYTPTAEKV